MKKLIGRFLLPRLSPEQLDREFRSYIVAFIVGIAFAGFIAAFAIQRYHQF